NAVYETPYENSSIQRDVEGFSVVEHIEIRKQILLEKTIDIVNLFSMTPYFFKTSKPDFEKLQALKTLETQTEFCISIYTAN
ncbi:MAG: methyltransferase, partial [Clostridia bacterium]